MPQQAIIHLLYGSTRSAEYLYMARSTVTFSISLPPEMAEELKEVMKKEHRTRSELIREALRRYIGI